MSPANKNQAARCKAMMKLGGDSDNRELFYKLQVRKAVLDCEQTWEWSEFLFKNDEFIETLSASKYCRRCRKIGPVGNIPVAHHPNIVWTTAEGLEKSRRRSCKYVEFQKWLEFLVENKTIILGDDHASFAKQLKETLETVHGTELLLPPFDWHYRQFFQVHLPAVSAPTIVLEEETPETQTEPETQTGPEIVKEKNSEFGTDKHQHEFLDFFISFYTSEYWIEEDYKTRITWYDDLITDLYMEPLGLLNLGYEISIKYPEHVRTRFGHSFVPFDIMSQKMTIDDLYEVIFM